MRQDRVVFHAARKQQERLRDITSASRDLRDTVRAAIKSGDWEVDGARDPELALKRLDAILEDLEGI